MCIVGWRKPLRRSNAVLPIPSMTKHCWLFTEGFTSRLWPPIGFKIQHTHSTRFLLALPKIRKDSPACWLSMNTKACSISDDSAVSEEREKRNETNASSSLTRCIHGVRRVRSPWNVVVPPCKFSLVMCLMASLHLMRCGVAFPR